MYLSILILGLHVQYRYLLHRLSSNTSAVYIYIPSRGDHYGIQFNSKVHGGDARNDMLMHAIEISWPLFCMHARSEGIL